MSDSESSLEPQKRKETSHVTDNEDALLAKKVKLAPKSQTKKPITKTSTKEQVKTAGTSHSKLDGICEQ